MAPPLPYHLLSAAALLSYAFHHLLAAAKSPHPKPYHPLPNPNRLPHLPLFLALAALSLSAVFHASSALSNPSSVVRLSSLQTLTVVLLFLLLSLSLYLRPLPTDLSFLLVSLSFALQSFNFSSPDDLSYQLDRISCLISGFSAFFSIILVVFPRSSSFELALAGSVALKGFWSLQTGLSLYVDAFIPEGCHRLIEIGGLTRCDLAESRVRAGVLLDLLFSVYVVVVAAIVGGVYGATARPTGQYEPLSVGGGDGDHVQMRVVGKSTMQA